MKILMIFKSRETFGTFFEQTRLHTPFFLLLLNGQLKKDGEYGQNT